MIAIQKREIALKKYCGKDGLLRKIINHELLIRRLTSTSNEEQIEDVLAEIEVALSYLIKGFLVEYEPNITNPPDLFMKSGDFEFFIEVKRVKDEEETRRERKFMDELKTRVEKIPIPYLIIFSPRIRDYTKYNSSINKRIVNVIRSELEKIDDFSSEMNIPIVLDSDEIGKVTVMKKLEDRSCCKLLPAIITLHDRTKSINKILKKANRKTILEDSLFFVVCKIEDFVTEYELMGGSKGQEVWKTYIEKQTGKYLGESVFRENKILGHAEHFKKINGVVFYGYNPFFSIFYPNVDQEINQEKIDKLLISDLSKTSNY